MNREQWEKLHEACPECGNTSLIHTLIGVPEINGHYEDNINSASCPVCGWNGPVKDLVQAKKSNKE